MLSFLFCIDSSQAIIRFIGKLYIYHINSSLFFCNFNYLNIMLFVIVLVSFYGSSHPLVGRKVFVVMLWLTRIIRKVLVS